MNNKISAHDPEPMIMLHKDRILVTVLSSPALYQWWGDGVVHLLCINGGEMEWCTFSVSMVGRWSGAPSQMECPRVTHPVLWAFQIDAESSHSIQHKPHRAY